MKKLRLIFTVAILYSCNQEQKSNPVTNTKEDSLVEFKSNFDALYGDSTENENNLPKLGGDSVIYSFSKEQLHNLMNGKLFYSHLFVNDSEYTEVSTSKELSFPDSKIVFIGNPKKAKKSTKLEQVDMIKFYGMDH